MFCLLKLDLLRKRSGYYPMEVGACSVYEVRGYKNGEAVELFMQDRGLLDIVEPAISVTMSPENALILAEQLRIAALAATGSHERGSTQER